MFSFLITLFDQMYDNEIISIIQELLCDSIVYNVKRYAMYLTVLYTYIYRPQFVTFYN